MHTSRTQIPGTAPTGNVPLITEADDEPGGYHPPLILRSTVQAPTEDTQTTGLLTRRRKRSARRAGRHG